MLHLTFNSRLLAEKDIYSIEKIDSLAELLTPNYSLCLVHNPRYRSDVGVEMTRITGFDRNGNADKIWVGTCGMREQGYLRCKLDKVLTSPFLFATWKKSGRHEIRLVQEHQILARFETFDEALDAYFPNGFIPEYSYKRRRSIINLILLAQQRNRELERLATILTKHRNK